MLKHRDFLEKIRSYPMQRDHNALIRMKQVQELLPACKASIYNFINRGILPPPIKVGRSSFWRYSEIVEIVAKLGSASEN